VPDETRQQLIALHLEQFDCGVDHRECFVPELKSAVEERLASAGVDHFRVEARAKSRASFEAKLRKDPTRKIQDLVGVRVLVFFRSDVALAEEVLMRMLILDTASYVDKADLLGDSEFGYRSVQFVGGEKKGGWDAEPDPISDAMANSSSGIEVQIRTLLEHGFAEVEHDIRYKPGVHDISPEVNRRFALTAGLLEQADTNLDDIRGLLGLGVEGTSKSRVADVHGWDAERFTQASRASIELDQQIRVALDLKKGRVLKGDREVARAARLAGWTTYSDLQAGIEQHGDLGRRLAIACADTTVAPVLIDFEHQWDHDPVGYPGIGLYWTALAVALGVNSLDPCADHRMISIPDGRLSEFQTVAKYLINHPNVPAPTIRDLYRAQAAPAGTTARAEFPAIRLS
jgi:ppGpp synthetase/RelA/SpoT-type nucleotidyltranferase